MPNNEITAEEWSKLPSPSDLGSPAFQERAEKFRTERSKAWSEFLEISSAAGYTIEDNLANRTLFMSGYESGKGAKNLDELTNLKNALKTLDEVKEG